MPYYTSQERIFAESDTIPSKRGTIYSKTVPKLNTFYSPKQSRKTKFLLDHSFNIEADKLSLKDVDKQKFVTAWLKTPQNSGFAQAKFQSSEPNYGRSSITTSQFILKRFFYKYGLFVVSPSKKRNSFQISKEERDYLTRSPYINNIKQCLKGVIETKNHTINQIHDQGEAFTQTQFNSGTIPQKIEVNVKSSCIPGDHINLTLYKNVDTSYLEPNVLQKLNFVIEHSFNQPFFVKDGLSAVKIGKHFPFLLKLIILVNRTANKITVL